MTYIGPGADDADVGQFGLSSEVKDLHNPLIRRSSSDGTNGKDLITLEKITLRDVLSSRVQITQAFSSECQSYKMPEKKQEGWQ